MSKQEEDRAYLESQQQIFIAAKVNRLCDAAYGGDLDLETYVSYAQELVDTFDPRLKPSPPQLIKLMQRLGGSRKTFVAATEHGNVSASYLDDKAGNAQTEEYRIGNYIARKRMGRYNDAVISFEHYLARSGLRSALERFPQATAIRYEQGTLDLQTISTYRLASYITGPFTVVLSGHHELMWRQDDVYRQKRASARSTQDPHKP